MTLEFKLKEIMTSLQDTPKSVVNPKLVFSLSQKAIENVVETLNKLEGVEIDSLFYLALHLSYLTLKRVFPL